MSFGNLDSKDLIVCMSSITSSLLMLLFFLHFAKKHMYAITRNTMHANSTTLAMIAIVFHDRQKLILLQTDFVFAVKSSDSKCSMC